MTKITLSIVALLILHTSLLAADKKEVGFIAGVQDTYANAKYFSCQANIISTHFTNSSPTRETSTDLYISLKKPNYFLIRWVSKSKDNNSIISEGTVWNNGEESYVYQNESNSYFSFNDFEDALIFSGQYSNYVSYKIPALFINRLSKGNWLSRLLDSGSNEIDKTGLILNNENITQNPIKKIEINLSPENFLISKMVTEIIQNRNPGDRIASLTSKKKDLIKKSDNYKTFLIELNTGDPEELFNELIKSIDKEIERQKLLPSDKKLEINKVIELYYNFKLGEPSNSVFSYELPSNAKYLGGMVDKAINKLK